MPVQSLKSALPVPSWALLSAMHWFSALIGITISRNCGVITVNGLLPIPNPSAIIADARQVSSLKQAFLTLMLRSLVEHSEYSEVDFCRRLDEDLFPFVDGTPIDGWPGGYTSQSIRET